MITISNGINSYQVYPDANRSGNLIVIGITGVDKGKAYVNTPEVYENWIVNAGYHQLKDNKKIPMFI